MKRGICILAAAITLCAGLPAHAARTGIAAPCAPDIPHEVRKFPSFITVHLDCDRVLLEIPPAMLGRDMLVSTEFAGLSTGSSEFAPGTSVANRVIRWRQRGSRPGRGAPPLRRRAKDSPDLQVGIERPLSATVLGAFDVVAQGESGAPIVDITPSSTTAVPAGFGLEFMRHYRMAGVDPKRSYVQGIRAFPTDIEFGSIRPGSRTAGIAQTFRRLVSAASGDRVLVSHEPVAPSREADDWPVRGPAGWIFLVVDEQLAQVLLGVRLEQSRGRALEGGTLEQSSSFSGCVSPSSTPFMNGCFRTGSVPI